MTVSAPPALALGRVAAVLALGSALVHVRLVDPASLGSLAMVGLALVCLPCAWHLWRRPTPGVWATTAAVDAAMLAVHAQLLAAAGPHARHHGAALGWLGLGLVVGQLAVAGVAAVRRPTGRAR